MAEEDSSYHVALLRRELARRCQKNRRYSMRAFAVALGIDPSALCRILNRKSALTRETGLKLVRAMRLDDGERHRFLRSIIQARAEKELELLEGADVKTAIGPATECPASIVCPPPRRPRSLSNPNPSQSPRPRSGKRGIAVDIPNDALERKDEASSALFRPRVLQTLADPKKIPSAIERVQRFLDDLREYLDEGHRTERFEVVIALSATPELGPLRVDRRGLSKAKG